METPDAMSMAPFEPELQPVPEFNVLPSVLDTLREARSRIGSDSPPLDLEIPGYSGALVARFVWKSARELAASAKSLVAIKDPIEQQIAAAADALHTCNSEILFRDGDKLESLQSGGVPVSFSTGADFAQQLGKPKPASARECVRAIVGNDYAIMNLAEKLGLWLAGATEQVAEEHLGE